MGRIVKHAGGTQNPALRPRPQRAIDARKHAAAAKMAAVGKAVKALGEPGLALRARASRSFPGYPARSRMRTMQPIPSSPRPKPGPRLAPRAGSRRERLRRKRRGGNARSIPKTKYATSAVRLQASASSSATCSEAARAGWHLDRTRSEPTTPGEREPSLRAESASAPTKRTSTETRRCARKHRPPQRASRAGAVPRRAGKRAVARPVWNDDRLGRPLRSERASWRGDNDNRGSDLAWRARGRQSQRARHLVP